MTKEEALKLVKRIKGAMVYTEEEKEALETLIPELKETEDERIRKELVEKISNLACGCFISQEQKQNFIAYLEKQKEQKLEVEGDNETEIQKAYREGKNAGRKEVFDHPEEYGLQLRRMYDYETGRRNPEWSEEDKEWLSEVYFAIDHSMYSENERQAMKKYIDSLRADRKTCDVDEFNPKPGDKFWVRCKTEKSENLWFDKGDERPAYAVNANGIITYIVHIKKDGVGNCVSYQDKDKFLNTFDIVDGKAAEQWPNLSNCKHDCRTCFARCLYRKERNPDKEGFLDDFEIIEK